MAQLTPKLRNVDNPWVGVHNMKITEESIKQLLYDGIPDWCRFPEDYKAFANESYLAEKEVSDKMAARYRMEDQEMLINEVARKVNPIHTRDLIQKLRNFGIKCYTIDNGYPPQTVALWAFKPGSSQIVPVCFLQVPAQYEWSILRLDKRGMPDGEAYRGWRTVESQLILKGIISEDQAHEIFGRPADGPVSRRFRETLYWFRNFRKQEDFA